MRTLVYLFAISLSLVCCKPEKKMVSNNPGNISAQPVDLTVSETVQGTLTLVEKADSVKQENVTLTQGADLMDYCIIVGSFMYEQNAIKLRNKLTNEGYWNSSIMRNSEGMYRVSILCDEALIDAQQDLNRIRSQYPQYKDAWLLKVKKSL